MNVFQQLQMYLAMPFVQYALIVGTLIALCSSLLGVTLVLKRFSFIGDGLSHVAFGAMAIAGVLRLTNEMLFVLPVTVLCAVLLLRTGQNAKIKGDAAIAMISVGALAIGYMLLNLFPLLFYNKIFAVTFDEDFARAAGVRAEAYNLLIAVVVAVIIVLAMNLVGSLLISALIIFPAVSAMRLFRSFKGVTVCSAILSVSCALIGMLVSILGSTPVGSTIVAVDIAVFLVFSLLARLGVNRRKA